MADKIPFVMFEDGQGNALIVREDPYVNGELFIERCYPHRAASWISLEPAEEQKLLDYLQQRAHARVDEEEAVPDV